MENNKRQMVLKAKNIDRIAICCSRSEGERIKNSRQSKKVLARIKRNTKLFEENNLVNKGEIVW